jgi:hypothetical protein
MAGQVQRALGNIGGPTHPAERASGDLNQESVTQLAELRRFLPEHRRVGIAGTDAGYADTLPSMVDGERLGALHRRTLRGAIRAATGSDPETGDRFIENEEDPVRSPTPGVSVGSPKRTRSTAGVIC